MAPTWDEIGNALIDLGEQVESLARDAGELIGEVSPQTNPKLSVLDPRKNQVKAAQFVAHLNYVGGDLRKRGEWIEEGTE